MSGASERGAAFKTSLRRRAPLLGAWTSFGHPGITEIFVTAGVDWVGIDLEHSTISQGQAQRIIAAAHAGGAACLPRVASHNGEQIARLLDSGADGIIVPNVETPEQVRALVRWTQYPPLGTRSYGIARAQGYGTAFDEYARQWNARSVVLIQIESKAGVEAVETLLAEEAVDGAMIGPYDLSGSLGVPGQLDHPAVVEACARVIEACRRRGRACGMQLVEPSEAGIHAAWQRGYSFVVLASDVFILWKWSARMRPLVEAARSVAVGR